MEEGGSSLSVSAAGTGCSRIGAAFRPGIPVKSYLYISYLLKEDFSLSVLVVLGAEFVKSSQ